MRSKHHEPLTFETPHLDRAVSMFEILADHVRVKIILSLRSMELSLNHLADIVNLSPSEMTEHLETLESAGVIRRVPVPRGHFYALANEHAGDLAANAIYHAQDQDHITTGTVAASTGR